MKVFLFMFPISLLGNVDVLISRSRPPPSWLFSKVRNESDCCSRSQCSPNRPALTAYTKQPFYRYIIRPSSNLVLGS